MKRVTLAVAVAIAALVVGGAQAGAPNKSVIRVSSGGGPLHLGMGFGSVWVIEHRGGYVYRIKPRSDKKRAIFVGDAMCGPPTFGGGYVWIGGCENSGTYQIDPRTNRVVRKRIGIVAPAFGAKSLWAVGFPNGAARVVRMDPRSGVRLATINPGFDISQNGGPVGVWDGSLWVAGDYSVSRIDVQTNKVTQVIPLPGGKASGGYPGGYLYGGYGAFAAGKFWVTDPAGLYEIDPTSNTATLLPIHIQAFSQAGDIYVAAAYGSVWLRTGNKSVVRLNPANGQVVRTYKATGGGGGLGVGFGSLWIANFGADSLWRYRLS